jgi:NAD-dependent dihydropyrimidine dehydrogenase PreA subunit
MRTAFKEQFFMAYVVTDACVCDFVCVTECATSAIAPQPGDAAAGTISQVYINPDDCIDCGSCASLCAQNAIYPEADLPADKAHFAEKNRAYFQ